MSINHPNEKQVIELGNYERCLLLILISGGWGHLEKAEIKGRLKEMGWSGLNLSNECIEMGYGEFLDLMIADTRKLDKFSGSSL